MVADVDKIETDIRNTALTRRMRPSLFFLDYDNLRSGGVTPTQFFRVLWENMGIKLEDDEEQALVAKYARKDGKTDWRKFCEVITRPFNAADVVTDPTCQQVEAREYLGTERSVRPLAVEDEVYMEQLLRRLQSYYNRRGINFRNLCSDFDPHNIGVIHESQFYRSFLKPTGICDEDIALLVDKYRDPDRKGLINYLNLSNDLDAIGEVMQDENRTSLDFVRDIGEYLPHFMLTDNPLQDLLDRIRVVVFKRGIRTLEFFKDYDRLRSGVVTERQFKSALVLAFGKEANLVPDDLQKIVEFYRIDELRVAYREFCDMLENAFNIPDLEKKPTQEVARPPPGALSRTLPILTEDEETRVAQVLDTIRKEVESRRLTLYPYFKDFERATTYSRYVTPSQFDRILHFLTIGVDPEDLKLLCRKFVDVSNGQINYPAFVQSVDKLWVNYTMERVKIYECEPCPKVDCEVKDVEEVDIHHLIIRLRHHVLVNRIRVVEFFQDYDPLRSGRVSKAQFERGLASMGLCSIGQHHLSAGQLQVLINLYEDPVETDKVQWTRFVADMESVFTLPHLEKDPNVQVPPSNIYEVPKPGTMDYRFASEDQKKFSDAVIARLANYIKERRQYVKPCFHQLDAHNNGHLTRAQFRQGLTIAELHCNDAEMQALESRFSNDHGVNYFAFLDTIDPPEETTFLYIDRVKTLRATNDKPPLPELDPAVSLETLMTKIKTKIYRERVRIHEWTHDYDKLRSGRMLKNHFRRALDLCNLQLQDSELSILEDHYQSVGHPDYVDYLRFSDDVEELFTTHHLEKAPEVLPQPFKPPQETLVNEVVPGREEILQNCLQRIAQQVRVQRMQLPPRFKDFDRTSVGAISRLQFRRVLDVLKLAALAPTETEWLCLFDKYQKKVGSRYDVNYLDFCDDIYQLAGFTYRWP